MTTNEAIDALRREIEDILTMPYGAIELRDFALADSEASREVGARGQAASDKVRARRLIRVITKLREAQELLAECYK